MQRRVSLGACHWGWERRVLSSVAFLHARPPFLWIRPNRMASNTVHRETDASSLYVYSVCVSVCLTTSKKLSFGEINRCFVQLVVRNNSQHCDSVSPRASAVVLPAVGDVESGANSGHGTYEWPFFLSIVFAHQPWHHSGSLLHGTKALRQLRCCHLDHNSDSHAACKY